MSSKEGTYQLAGCSFIIFFIFWYYGLEKFSIFNVLSKYNLYPLGFYGPDFSSSDYFPLIPWFFLFLTGYFIGKYHQHKNEFLKNIEFKSGFLAKLGRHSLVIYMLHQPIIYGVLRIINK